MNESVAVGWDAIEEQMKRLYKDQEPKHYGTSLPYKFGGNDPLDGLSAYKATSPVPHWHIVTFGFSELYTKESENMMYSGYGFELTFRVARQEDEEEPPIWALNLLQNMGRYVFNSGNIFVGGDYLDANGPICLGADTLLTALAFIEDPELPSIHTPNGRVEFLQMVGISGDELEAMKTWSTAGLLEAGQSVIPGYVTDLSRDSMLDIPAVAAAVEQGIERDGSNTGFLFVDELAFEPGKKKLFRKTPAKLTIGAKQAETVGKLLRGRLLKGKDLSLSSRDCKIILESAEATSYEKEAEAVKVHLSTAVSSELSQKLQAKEGILHLSSYDGLIIQIVKTYIKDQEGKVVSTVG